VTKTSFSQINAGTVQIRPQFQILNDLCHTCHFLFLSEQTVWQLSVAASLRLGADAVAQECGIFF
jgi:hypothetical protein